MAGKDARAAVQSGVNGTVRGPGQDSAAAAVQQPSAIKTAAATLRTAFHSRNSGVI
jgi:hypothetical protein